MKSVSTIIFGITNLKLEHLALAIFKNKMHGVKN